MKKRAILCTMLIVGMLCGGCTVSQQNDASSGEAIVLTDEETRILKEMGSDVHVVAEDGFQELIAAIQAHTHEYVGQVYQLEGVYTMQDVHGESTPYLVNTYTIDGQETAVGLPLRYLEKQLTENMTVRVTAIIGEEEHDEHAHATLDVVAVESIGK